MQAVIDAIKVELQHRFLVELRRSPDLTSVPLSSQVITDDMGDLVDEAFVRGVMNEELPADGEELHVRIEPVFSTEPLVERINVELSALGNGVRHKFKQSFESGRWVRSSQSRIAELKQEGTLEANESAYRMVLAVPEAGSDLTLPSLEAPEIVDGSLEPLGMREFGEGELVPDRPVLINRRLAADSIDACLAAGVRETGKAVLGLHVRLPEPLPNTSTRIVTLLTACVDDHRHTGDVNQWHISPAALEDAAAIADLRGLGERVLTVVHTHGWSNECGKCNENANCPLTECTQVSLKDYQVLEQLFPSKATLMPIAGRKLGAPSKRPVLEVHAWRGGAMKPVRWQQYGD